MKCLPYRVVKLTAWFHMLKSVINISYFYLRLYLQPELSSVRAPFTYFLSLCHLSPGL